MAHREHSWLVVFYTAQSKTVEITAATAPEVRNGAPRSDKRTAYCHQQAAECASAATTVISGEIRQAYLNIEQAWLRLAPEINNRRKDGVPGRGGGSPQSTLCSRQHRPNRISNRDDILAAQRTASAASAGTGNNASRHRRASMTRT
jgi:hypothetical protein